MKTTRIGIAALLALVPLAACGQKDDEPASEPPSTDEVPSQDDADAAATEEITEDNADEAMEELADEIEDDGQ